MLDPVAIYKELKHQLYELDQEREIYYKKVEPIKYIFWSFTILGGSALIYFINFTSVDVSPVAIFIYGGGFFILVITYLIIYHHNLKQFKHLFTQHIAPRIISGLGPAFMYEYEAKIPISEIRNSLLFGEFDRYKCQDLVIGVLDETPIKFAEISLEKVKTGDSRNKTTYTIFKGIYMSADIQLTFPTDVWIIQKGHTKTARELNKPSFKLDHPVLKNYRLFADDMDLGEKILHPSILNRIGTINEKLRKIPVTRPPVAIHFGKKQIQIAIKTTKGFLDPKLGQSIDSEGFVRQQTDLLNVLSTLLDDLTLK